MKNKELAEAVVKRIQVNHIWINAFSLVNPSPETLQGIGEEIVRMLKDKGNLLPAWHGETKGEVSGLAELTPMLYLRINAS